MYRLLPKALCKKRKRACRNGYSLVEVSLALGLISGGLLIITPLMTVGLNQSRQAQDKRMSTQIAETFLQEAEQGTLRNGTYLLDQQGAACAAAQATYRVAVTTQPTSSGANRLSLQIIPTGAPENVVSYAALTVQP